MIRTLIAIIATVMLVIFQVSFFSSFTVAPYLHLVLIATVLITTFVSYQRGFVFALLAGLLLDLYSPFGLGSITVALMVPIIIIYYLLRRLLAHKSVYTLAVVMAISTLAYNLTLFILVNLSFWLNWHELNITLSARWLQLLAIQVAAHTVLVALLFVAMRFLSQKIRARFFISERV